MVTIIVETVWLVQIDNVKCVRCHSNHSLHSEVEPLCVLGGVEVKVQPEIVLIGSTTHMHT